MMGSGAASPTVKDWQPPAEKGSLEPLISCTTRPAEKTEMTAAVQMRICRARSA